MPALECEPSVCARRQSISYQSSGDGRNVRRGDQTDTGRVKICVCLLYLGGPPPLLTRCFYLSSSAGCQAGVSFVDRFVYLLCVTGAADEKSLMSESGVTLVSKKINK